MLKNRGMGVSERTLRNKEVRKVDKKKKKKVSKAARTPEKPLVKEVGVNSFDYFCELWDRFKNISRNSSV